jgi:hypothetical protein
MHSSLSNIVSFYDSQKLHLMLEDAKETGDPDIVSFLQHGRAFKIHDLKTFPCNVLLKYF